MANEERDIDLLERFLFARRRSPRPSRDVGFLFERVEELIGGTRTELGPTALRYHDRPERDPADLSGPAREHSPRSRLRSPSEQPSRSASELAQKAEAIKRHTVQLEAICLGTILFVVLPQLQPAISQLLGPTATFLLPFPFLSAIAWLAPVVNPEDSIRSRIKWGLTGLGAGATIGGGIAGVLTLSVGAPVGALIGGAATSLTRPSKPPNGKIKPIPMFYSDGIIKCAKQDVDEWLRTKVWQ